VRYTIIGDQKTLTQKRILFLDAPTSSYTVQGFYSVTVDPLAVQAIPDEFLPAIKAYLIYEITPSYVVINGQKINNPAKTDTKQIFMLHFSKLVSKEQARPGRVKKMKLDGVGKGAYQYYHK